MTGGYDPTSTVASARLHPGAGRGAEARGHRSRCCGRGTPARIPGYVFTGAPLKLASGHFGLGHGSGAHAPDEYYVIESTQPEGAGLRRRGDVVRRSTSYELAR